MAGPCSVESEKQIVEVAKAVKASGANFLISLITVYNPPLVSSIEKIKVKQL